MAHISYAIYLAQVHCKSFSVHQIRAIRQNIVQRLTRSSRLSLSAHKEREREREKERESLSWKRGRDKRGKGLGFRIFLGYGRYEDSSSDQHPAEPTTRSRCSCIIYFPRTYGLWFDHPLSLWSPVTLPTSHLSRTPFSFFIPFSSFNCPPLGEPNTGVCLSSSRLFHRSGESHIVFSLRTLEISDPGGNPVHSFFP